MLAGLSIFSAFCFRLSLPFLAQAGPTSITVTDGTFGGATTFIAKAFWAFMMLCFALGVISGMVAIAMSFRQQEVPVMAFVIIGCMLALPTLSFIIANMMGLSTVTSFFT